MDIIKSTVGRITGRAENLVNEKADPNHTDKDRRTTQAVATDVLNVLRDAEKNGRDLKRAFQNIVGEYGSTEKVATAILSGVEKILKNGAPMAQAMKDAFQRATNAAEAFAREHPVYCTVIALGILVILAPWVIEALGFGELGPIEGTFAALWQAKYAGYVPKGSLFSFFQRLGMIWKWTLHNKAAFPCEM